MQQQHSPNPNPSTSAIMTASRSVMSGKASGPKLMSACVVGRDAVMLLSLAIAVLVNAGRDVAVVLESVCMVLEVGMTLAKIVLVAGMDCVMKVLTVESDAVVSMLMEGRDLAMVALIVARTVAVKALLPGSAMVTVVSCELRCG